MPASSEQMKSGCWAVEKLGHASDRRCGCRLLGDGEEMGALAVGELIEPLDDREENIVATVDDSGDDEGALHELPQWRNSSVNGGNQKACDAQGQPAGDDLVLHLLSERFKNHIDHVLILCVEGSSCNFSESLSECFRFM